MENKPRQVAFNDFHQRVYEGLRKMYTLLPPFPDFMKQAFMEKVQHMEQEYSKSVFPAVRKNILLHTIKMLKSGQWTTQAAAEQLEIEYGEEVESYEDESKRLNKELDSREAMGPLLNLMKLNFPASVGCSPQGI